LRKIAKELGVSHSLLVLWRQGKRSLSPQLEFQYHQLVTTVTTGRGEGGKIVSGGARSRIKSPVTYVLFHPFEYKSRTTRLRVRASSVFRISSCPI